jgi:hypothetical protein
VNTGNNTMGSMGKKKAHKKIFLAGISINTLINNC